MTSLDPNEPQQWDYVDDDGGLPFNPWWIVIGVVVYVFFEWLVW